MDASTPAGASTASGVPAVSYGLSWGIKDSFVEYIQRMPDGQGSLSSGAYRTESGTFVFPPVQSGVRVSPDGVEERMWQFDGDVRFGGHYGMLFVRVASPWIAVSGGVGELSVEDPHATDDEKRQLLAMLALRPIDTPDGLVGWASTEVLLHPSAVALFNEVYPPGEPLEPFTILLPDR